VTLIFNRSGTLIRRFDGYTKEAALRAVIEAALQ